MEQAARNRPSRKKLIESLGLPISIGYQLLKVATENRNQLRMNHKEREVSWLRVKSRRGYKKVSVELRKNIYGCFLDHPHVMNSPINNDTIIIRGENNKKTRVGKLLPQIYIRELQHYFLSAGLFGFLEGRDISGAVIISDTALQLLLRKKINRMSI